MRRSSIAFCALLALPTMACEKCAPGTVGSGVARLTVRNLGTLASALNDDARCGFASEAVLASAEVTDEGGGLGTVTWRVTDCVLDLSARPYTSTDCLGVTTTARGKVTVSARRVVRGILTGDAKEPVVPMRPDAVLVVIERAVAELFKVESSDSDSALTILEGSISGTIAPRLASSASNGVCSIATAHARLTDITYEGAMVRVQSDGRDFAVDVPRSSLAAVNGRIGEEENRIEGHITVWDDDVALPNDDDGLDPEYDRARFEDAFACTDDLALPLGDTCADPTEALGEGAARLTVQMLGTLVGLTDDDGRCGFQSLAVMEGASITGTLGHPGGTATFAVRAPCTLTFSEPTMIGEDCTGERTFVEGTAVVTATKRLSGIVSGDPAEPIVPTSRDPAEVQLDADLSGFRVWTEPGAGTLEAVRGHLSGTVRPRVAIDTETGACSIATPVAALSDIHWGGATLKLSSGDRSFELDVPRASLEAVNGSRDGVTNHLAGSIAIGDRTIELPIAAGRGLVPSYDQQTFDASYACTRNLRIPASDTDCDMTETLAAGAARLLVQTLGAVTGISNDDRDCGYSAHLTRPSRIEGEPGDHGAMEWTIAGCELGRTGRDATRPYETDCLGRDAYLSGNFTVSGMRHIEGKRTEYDFILFGIQAIKPDSPESVTVHQDTITFDELTVFDLDPNEAHPRRAITVHRGTMRARVEPITGERADEPGRFDVATSVARMSDVEVTDAEVTIVSDRKAFALAIDRAELRAFNGSYARTGEKNTIAGTISVGGRTFTLDPAPLDPDFDQADFDARYACTDNLRQTVPPAR